VNGPDTLKIITESLVQIAQKVHLIFPIHPRTKKNLQKTDLLSVLETSPDITITEPMNYIRFMNLVFNTRMVITDSGGIQEETTYLGIPCLTLRPNTERPITVTQGTNRLCKPDRLKEIAESILQNDHLKEPTIPDLWDGNTAGRVVNSIERFINN
jgi:UDP-N-acetylglucosamine 2-epimerase (non-hydrolysing)